MPAMNDSRVLSCHHYKIIAVLRYAIARLCQNHKKQVGSRQGAARDKNGKPELVEKLARRLGLVMSLISALSWYCFFHLAHLA